LGKEILGSLIAAIVGLAGFRTDGRAAQHEFYDGKTMRIIVGYAPGGGYDFSARTVSHRHCWRSSNW
jgi:tripartite-type tricarboxylate transporter receptor subunit TctC